MSQQDTFELIQQIRALTFDTNTDKYRNDDHVIARYISTIIPSLSFDISFNFREFTFNRLMNSKQKLEISCRASLIILSGMPSYFHYKTPVMTATRRYDTGLLIQKIEDLLQSSTGSKKFASSSYDEIKKLANDTELFMESSM
jgi:hypothetical protein